MEWCPCTSGLPYEACCRRFHGGELAETARELMRSRFSAYALGLLDYIIETTHPGSSHYSDNKFAWKRKLAEFSRSTRFEKLDILDFQEHGLMAIVVFTAHLSRQGEDTSFTERSYFEKRNGRWLYWEGRAEMGSTPHRVQGGAVQLLPLAFYGDPILREKARAVEEITPEIQKLALAMIETMDALNGMGIAAPQVKQPLRMFITRPFVNEAYEDPKVFINPEIIFSSKECRQEVEGCLSIPSLRGKVERPSEVTVQYTTLEGQRVEEHFSLWPARTFLHEYDHIEGILYVDRLAKEEKEAFAPFLKNLANRVIS